MIAFSEYKIKKARLKLGEPVMSVELEDEQIVNCFAEAVSNWELYALLSNLSEDKLNKISSYWVENYFFALCKENLARIRSKFQGKLPLPGTDVTLEYESLLTESDREKENLIGLLIPVQKKMVLAFYINVGNMEHSDVKPYIENIKKLATNKNEIHYFIPVRDQETRIECIYPNFTNDEEIKSKLNIILDDIINKIQNEE